MAGGFETRLLEEVDVADPEQRLVAVIERIVFLLQVNLDRVTTKPQEIIITGGLSRSLGFCQRIAALAGLPARRSPRAEASMYGAARKLAASVPALPTEPVAPRDDVAADAVRQRYASFTAAMGSTLR